MRYVKLSTTGEGSLSMDRARQYMTAARTAVGTPGEMQITQPQPDGVYFLAFANHAHATRFVEIARSRGARLESLMQLPEGVTICRRPQQQASGGEQIIIAVLGAADGLLDLLFRGPGKPGAGSNCGSWVASRSPTPRRATLLLLLLSLPVIDWLRRGIMVCMFWTAFGQTRRR